MTDILCILLDDTIVDRPVISFSSEPCAENPVPEQIDDTENQQEKNNKNIALPYFEKRTQIQKMHHKSAEQPVPERRQSNNTDQFFLFAASLILFMSQTAQKKKSNDNSINPVIAGCDGIIGRIFQLKKSCIRNRIDDRQKYTRDKNKITQPGKYVRMS